MILRAHRFRKGTDSKQRALGSLGVSHRAQILDAADSAALRALVLLGLIEGSEIRVEARDFRGGVTIEAGGRRMHIPAYLAQRIWVQPVYAPGIIG
nr:FeoA family protein [Thioalkalivibrio sp.]